MRDCVCIRMCRLSVIYCRLRVCLMLEFALQCNPVCVCVCACVRARVVVLCVGECVRGCVLFCVCVFVLWGVSVKSEWCWVCACACVFAYLMCVCCWCVCMLLCVCVVGWSDDVVVVAVVVECVSVCVRN